MSVTTLRSIVELDVDVDLKDDTKRQVWIQLAKTGAFRGHSAGPFELSAKTFDEIVRNFRATNNRRVAIDFEHASEVDASAGAIPTQGAPAQGWILDLDNRGDSGLWGLVEWLEPARTYIREGKYRFFSPAIRFGARDRVTGKPIGAVLSSGGLTNQPFLDGMTPLAAKDTSASSADGDIMNWEELYKSSQEKVATLTAENTTLSGKVEAITAEHAKLSLSLKDVTATKENDAKELEGLRKFKVDTEETMLVERVELAFATYKDAKKLTNDDKEAMRIVLKSNATTFEKLYPKVDPTKQHLLRNVTEQRETTTALTVIDGGAGDDTSGETVQQTTKRLMREKKMSYVAAQNAALKLRSGR